ncbi:MAG TPA: HAD family hydrolase, partial [Ottowia sp.]|nr:HAD family hydrolase [Ottowia sp.]
MRPHRLDLRRIRAITLDLDDTLWPVWPTIARAEDALRAWLHTRAPRTASLARDADAARQAR